MARYKLRGYCHYGKGVESFLRSIGADAADSGRSTMAEFKRVKEESLSGFEEALEQPRDEGKEV